MGPDELVRIIIQVHHGQPLQGRLLEVKCRARSVAASSASADSVTARSRQSTCSTPRRHLLVHNLKRCGTLALPHETRPQDSVATRYCQPGILEPFEIQRLCPNAQLIDVVARLRCLQRMKQ